MEKRQGPTKINRHIHIRRVPPNIVPNRRRIRIRQPAPLLNRHPGENPVQVREEAIRRAREEVPLVQQIPLGILRRETDDSPVEPPGTYFVVLSATAAGELPRLVQPREDFLHDCDGVQFVAVDRGGQGQAFAAVRGFLASPRHEDGQEVGESALSFCRGEPEPGDGVAWDVGDVEGGDDGVALERVACVDCLAGGGA